MKRILIADSGSTKTDWLLLNDSTKAGYFHTKGLNPFFASIPDIKKQIEKVHSEIKVDEINSVFFYGSGIKDDKSIYKINKAIATVFPNTQVFAYSDILGAARASLNLTDGIACILGTGSNTCLYKNHKIAYKIPALGYILGDEGSGAVLGRNILNLYLKGIMPLNLQKEFAAHFAITEAQVLENIYRKPFANRYLASFSVFLSKFKQDVFIHQFLLNSFDDFMVKNILPYENYQSYPIGMIGSIAFYFKDIIQEVSDKYGLMLKKVIEKTIEALGDFHSRVNKDLSL